ncbi:c-type cytochrome [Tunturiibacter gelidoferens]|uniref:c-type cytochrome n=1 Tax=Tunturiibacter gelidiferens TaxID=3069689 RepID=UPI0033427299
MPSVTETKVINWTKHITIGGKKDANPVAASAENIEDGKQGFTSYCMVCHGLDGQNRGVPFAASVSPPIPSLASAEIQSYTDGQLSGLSRTELLLRVCPPLTRIFPMRICGAWCFIFGTCRGQAAWVSLPYMAVQRNDEVAIETWENSHFGLNI